MTSKSSMAGKMKVIILLITSEAIGHAYSPNDLWDDWHQPIT